MRKTFKKIALAIFTFILMIGMVDAETISSSFTVDSYKYSNPPMTFPQQFRVKKTSTGKYAYCVYYSKNPPTGQKYTKSSTVTDKGMSYILEKSMADGADSNSDFFVYQTALWIYMADKGIMEGSYNSVTTFKNNVNNSSSATATKIKKLVSDAKKASSSDTSIPTISVGNTSKVKFTLSGDNYVSDKIAINSSVSDYSVSLTSAPSGSTYEKGKDYIKIIVPANKVTNLSTTIKFSVSNTKNIYSAYIYKTSSSSYQPVAVPFKETTAAVASGSVDLLVDKDITISKQDIATSEELPGAELVLKDSNGNVVDSWTSTTTPHVVKGLSAGTYTLNEKIAPNGYILSDETITFTIDDSGNLKDSSGKSIDKVVMYNEHEPIKETGVSISKQDITNKKELPGAHLVVKDYDGNVIKEWISTDKPTYIQLKPGIYTLNEKIAPNGYILSNETITFTVKEDGTIDKVVMYNTPNSKEDTVVEVENTASFSSIAPTLFGLSIIVVGIAMIFRSKKTI